MQTKIWRIEGATEERAAAMIGEAAALLRDGGIVAFPTETVYGLGADARSDAAVERIFTAKGRPADNPLIVHVADHAQADALIGECGAAARRLMERLWPGPLTLVLPLKPGAVAARVTAGLDTVALRMPDHPLALRLIAAAGCPVAAPSANRSGRPSPTTARHVLEDLDGRIDGVLDGGPAGVGLESTVVRVAEAGRRLEVLRPGGVTVGELRAAVPDAEIVVAASDAAEGQAPRSPGMKYKHYAPRGRLLVIRSADPERAARRMQQELDRRKAQGETTGALLFGAAAAAVNADVVVTCGHVRSPAEIARQLYAALRRFDEAGATFIVSEAVAEEGLGLAIMNRLLKAAGDQVVDV